jgi:hypothetical protein
MIKVIITIAILLLVPSMASASINGIEIFEVMTDTEGNGGGVYLLFNFAFHYLMLYMFAPVCVFKAILLILESAGSNDD